MRIELISEKTWIVNLFLKDYYSATQYRKQQIPFSGPGSCQSALWTAAGNTIVGFKNIN